jgi:hypothetical protein
MIDDFVGIWSLTRNSPGLENFMKYYGYGYLKRKAALMSNVDLVFHKMDDNTLHRTIKSTFMKADEFYPLTGQDVEANREGLIKNHTLDADGTTLISKVHNSKCSWTETTFVTETTLTLTRRWIVHDVSAFGHREYICSQLFQRK